MIIDNIAFDKNVDSRLKTLKSLNYVCFEKVSEYERMPEIIPLDNQIYLFKDGFEAIIDKELVEGKDHKRYKCVLVNEGRKKIIKYTFKGRDYKPSKD